MNINIAETFYSIQGEGPLTGIPMYFIRFGGCTVSDCFLHPVNTNLCDTNWKKHMGINVDDVVAHSVQSIDWEWCCITGGEP